MSDSKPNGSVPKLPTGIPGFDEVSYGGLPKGRTTLLAGSGGSGKTVMACQFLAAGIRSGEPGVFVTFEEAPEDIRKNVASLGWDIAGWESEGKWAFVDASPRPVEHAVVTGPYDLGGLLARIEHAIRKTGATRVSIDSLGAVFSQIRESGVVRSEIFRLAAVLKTLRVTAILTAERTDEKGAVSRFGVEEFVSDNVVVLRNILEEEKRRRTLEILKFRGTPHQKGQYPFTILPDSGVVVIPLSSIRLTQKSANLRIRSGIEELDRMCGGGFFQDSIVLVSGATGTGKTLTTTEFLGAPDGERRMLFAFEESRDQLSRNASGWGVDYETMERDGMLRVVCNYPEVHSLEDHLIHMRAAIEEFQPARVALDSISALERVSTARGFREFVVGLTSFLKEKRVASMFTATTPTIMGGTSVTETHISTITDSIILLRYVEMYGEMRRGITVLKMRGSRHDRDIREFTIDNQGMQIGRPFRNVVGILAGRPSFVGADEAARLAGLFRDENVVPPEESGP